MSIVSEPSDVRIRLADGKELPATIVLRDQDLDLAFIRPTAKPAAPLTAVNLADAASPTVLEDLVVLGRLGRVGGWVPSASLYSVAAIDRTAADVLRAERPGGHRHAGVPAERQDRRLADDPADRSRAHEHVRDDGRHRRGGRDRRGPAGGRRPRDRQAGERREEDADGRNVSGDQDRRGMARAA